jgi:hypothetical protein
VLRPGLAWLLGTRTLRFLAAEMARTRDPDGFSAVSARALAAPVNRAATGVALHRIAVITAAKGGGVAGICVGDCLELLAAAAETSGTWYARSPYFYQLLHAAGMLDASAPPAIRMVRWRGQPAVEELIGQYGIQCGPVRDLLVAYLAERQPALDFSSSRKLADALGPLFWRDLELHHPGRPRMVFARSDQDRGQDRPADPVDPGDAAHRRGQGHQDRNRDHLHQAVLAAGSLRPGERRPQPQS